MSEQEFKQVRQSNASKHKAILRRKGDVFRTSPRSWFHLGHDGKVHVVNQRFGKAASGQVTLTRAEFEKFIKFYERGLRGGEE